MLDSISFIGGGVMAEAMIQGLLNKALVHPEEIIATGPRQKRREELQKRYGIQVTADNRQAAQAGEIIVLSVKPRCWAQSWRN